MSRRWDFIELLVRRLRPSFQMWPTALVLANLEWCIEFAAPNVAALELGSKSDLSFQPL